MPVSDVKVSVEPLAAAGASEVISDEEFIAVLLSGAE
jgi:hypothetical protein